MIPIRAYPKSVMIGETEWKVRFVRRIPDERDHIVGLCCEASETIYLKLGQGRFETAKTFAHEVLHAFEFEYGIAIPHKLIYQLEAPVTLFFLQNIAA